jgi:hypothetical protein
MNRTIAMLNQPHDETPTNEPAQRATPLRELIQDALDRRNFLHVAWSTTCGAVVTAAWDRPVAAASPLSLGERASHDGEGGTDVGPSPQGAELFQFKSVPVSQADEVVVPEGYVAEVIYRWGDPINGSAPVFRTDASNSAADQALQAGMGHDGMEYFAIPGVDPNQRGLLCVNHEYTDQILLFADGMLPFPPERMPLEKVRKSQASHGVSIVEIAREETGSWRVVPSRYARRITAESPLAIAGPAVELIGEHVQGTLNNCAAGRTPWGTYLTCEENIQGVFGTDNPAYQTTDDHRRFGMQPNGFTYTIAGQAIPAFRWWQQDARFDLAHPDNDSQRFGYVVEIDPLRPDLPPVKRTALGRCKHENAEVALAADGRVVVYMGDDEADQFIYKYVSRHRYDPGQTAAFGVAARGGLLDDGTLYVAQYQPDGRGRWLALVPGQNQIPTAAGGQADGWTSAQICVHTRRAAELAGATPMDRPEWITVHPVSGEVFASLTNNKGRKMAAPANPRTANIYGHVLRWREAGNDAAAETFEWKVFVMGGSPAAPEATHRGDSQGDGFACPDGLKFDRSGILWIQTDMSSSVIGKPEFVDLGHNMMLAADPNTGAIRRFLTGPRGCEISGNTMTPDRKTMFVNIQHPGEPADDVSDPTAPNQYSSWPDGADSGRPRSATIAIRRIDGKEIGM